MPDPVVLVLGGGIAGVAAAREARRLLPDSCRIVVIDKDTLASYPPSYPWVMTAERRPEAIRRPRARLAQKGIEFVPAEVRQIDTANRYVRAGSREFRYDYLVLALGAETPLDTRPGLAEAAQSFYTLDSAERLAASLRYFGGGQVALVVAGLPFKGPATPYEAAMLVEHYFHERRMRQKVQISIYTPEGTPLEALGGENAEAVMGLLAHKGIDLHLGAWLETVDPARHELVFGDGATAGYNLLIAVPEHRVPAAIREAGLADESGWVPVNPRTMETAYLDVFAAGDLVSIAMPGGGLLPRTAGLAEHQAEAAARQIAYRIHGGKPPAHFDASARIFLEVGAGAAALFEGDFLASPPRISMKQPSIVWHWAQLALERYWLMKW